MRSVLVVPAVLGHLVLLAAPAFAVVGGGEITMQNKGGNEVFSHELHVARLGNACQSFQPKLYTTSKQHKAATKATGDCIMPKEGSFPRVIHGEVVK